MSVGSPGDSYFQPTIELAIDAAITLAVVPKPRRQTAETTYLVAGAVTDGNVLSPILQYVGRPGTSSRNIFKVLPGIQDCMPRRKNEHFVIICHELVRKEISMSGRTKVSEIRIIRIRRWYFVNMS